MGEIIEFPFRLIPEPSVDDPSSCELVEQILELSDSPLLVRRARRRRSDREDPGLVVQLLEIRQSSRRD